MNEVDYIMSTKTQTASMLAQGFLAILAIFMFTTLVMVILSQQQVLTVLYGEEEKLLPELERLDDQLSKLDSSVVLLGESLAQGGKVIKDLEAEVAKPRTDMEKMKAEMYICQAEKKTKADELAAKEKECTETDANLKSEFDAWNQEIQNLKAQVNGYRPICDYVMDDTRAKKLCGTKGEPLV